MPAHLITTTTLRFRARRHHGVTLEEWAEMTLAEYAALERDRTEEIRQRERSASARTAAIMALLCNLQRKKGTRPYTADDFLPRPRSASNKSASELMATFATLTRQNRRNN